MPACYAHYRFGAEIFSVLPEKIRGTVARCRDAYDLGVHGPDIFFYHNPFVRTPVVEKGSAIHHRSGKELFTRGGRKLRLTPSDRGTAYLFGVLCHYALDSVCHPSICAWDREGISPHVAIESEFDRFLLEKDGKIPPHRQDLSPHLRKRGEDMPFLAELYGVSREETAKSCGNFIRITKFLCPTGKVSRQMTERIMKSAGMGDYMIPSEPDIRSCQRNGYLFEKYTEAKEKFPILAMQLADFLESGTALGEEFVPTFG